MSCLLRLDAVQGDWLKIQNHYAGIQVKRNWCFVLYVVIIIEPRETGNIIESKQPSNNY